MKVLREKQIIELTSASECSLFEALLEYVQENEVSGKTQRKLNRFNEDTIIGDIRGMASELLAKIRES